MSHIPLGLKKWKKQGRFPSSVVGASSSYEQAQTSSYSTYSPIDGAEVGEFSIASAGTASSVARKAHSAFIQLRSIPAPRRGDFVRRFGNLVRQHKVELAEIITLEAGKTNQEALGEVQEIIDICDFAVGLSRQLHGLTIASERPEHRMMEQWHPLGPVLVISAFNFPMAVWAWNAALAFVCGDSVVWKPSEQTSLCALAMQQLIAEAARQDSLVPEAISSVVLGGRELGQALAEDRRFALVSATGSVAMGRQVAQAVAPRLGRCLLELGGNNAMIVAESADLELALRGMVFSAVGTTGQRCTTLRRGILHKSVAQSIKSGLVNAYASLSIGDPRVDSNIVGPLVNEKAFACMNDALKAAVNQGGSVLYGGERVTKHVPEGGVYVKPAIVEISGLPPIVKEETFAPIMYLTEYETLDEAIAIQNGVSQGLSSAIFTRDVSEAEFFLSACGSDCGIANVNIGTSGAEIGGAFGGEKDTGGGRESGSDAWKNYMRRATNTINYGSNLPLAQGIQFDL